MKISRDREKIMRRWKEQRWILDNIIRTVGVDWDQGRTSRLVGFAGPKASWDAQLIRQRVKRFADIAREFAKAARLRQERAEKAEAEGHAVLARENYFIAAQLYCNAHWPLFEDDSPKHIEFQELQDYCFGKYIRYAPHPIERVEIPFEGRSLSALLHLPASGRPPYPAVLIVPGMDMVKENSPMYGDPLLERGLAFLMIDGPGQGASNVRKIRVTADNYAEAGVNAVNYLCSRKDIDASRLGLAGVSMGTYWGFRVAAAETRLKACAFMLPCWESGMDTIFNMASPTFKLNYMYMAGYSDEASFDRFMETLSLEGLEEKISCPVMLITGEDEDLSPMDVTLKVFGRIRQPRKLVMFEGSKHSIEAPYVDHAADWLADWLAGKKPRAEKVYVELSGREVVSPLD
ncbi:MAG: alpha/beta hydrolase [Candidatus Tectomicrobia bacterium]|nr:alpha/beta hydrolase [Candidatus Tectomicrobia bacterium]